MKSCLALVMLLCPPPLMAQLAEGDWACRVEISGDPVMPGAGTDRYVFALSVLPDGTAEGKGSVEDASGVHPISIAAAWVLEGQAFTATGTLSNGAPQPFSFLSEFVSAYEMVLEKTFGSGVKYVSTCEKRG